MPEKDEQPVEERPDSTGSEALSDQELEQTAGGRRTSQVGEQPEERATSVAPEDHKGPSIGGVTPLPDPPFYTQP